MTALGLAARARPLAFSVAPAPDAVVAPVSPRGGGHIVALAGQEWLRVIVLPISDIPIIVGVLLVEAVACDSHEHNCKYDNDYAEDGLVVECALVIAQSADAMHHRWHKIGLFHNSGKVSLVRAGLYHSTFRQCHLFGGVRDLFWLEVAQATFALCISLACVAIVLPPEAHVR